MRPIPVGAQGSFTLVVSSEHLANRFKDATLPPVLATPVMIMAMENAALNAIKPYFDAGAFDLTLKHIVQKAGSEPEIGKDVADTELDQVGHDEIIALRHRLQHDVGTLALGLLGRAAVEPPGGQVFELRDGVAADRVCH